MKVAPLPVNERERLKTLNDYYILDSLPDTDFEEIAGIVAEICRTSVVSVCLFDAARQWFKCTDNRINIDFINNFTIGSTQIVTIIPDTLNEDQYLDNPYVTNEPFIRFVVMVKLVSKEGLIIGTLCIFDNQPGNLSCNQITALEYFAKQIVSQLDLRKKISDLKQLQIEQQSAYADLEKFSFVASHDLRSPLNNIISLTHLLKDNYAHQLDEDGKDYVYFLNNAANQLADLVSGILEYSRSSQMLVDNKERINIPELIQEVIGLLHAPENITIQYSNDECYIFTSRIAMKQILLNLCDNAIKHNDKDKGIITISTDEGKKYFTFIVKDNGPGIPAKDQKRVFELFERIKHQTKEKDGIGVGLSIVKRLVEKLGGEVKVSSEEGAGTAFIFTIQK